MTRDLLAASYAGLLSVPAMSRKMQTIFGDSVVPDFAPMSDAIRAWLTAPAGDGIPFDATDVDRIARDPPLSFYVLIEADVTRSGQTLGPIGSIIVAETVFGALRSNPTGFEMPGSSLADRIRTCAASFYETDADSAERILANLGRIASMPALLDYLHELDAFPATPEA